MTLPEETGLGDDDDVAMRGVTMTRIPSTTVDQRRLYQHYHSVPDAAAYAEMLDMEQRWIVALTDRFEAEAPRFMSLAHLLDGMRAFLAEEAAVPSDNHSFLALEATIEQFKVVVAEFAVDGLTESQSLLPIVSVLPYKAAMSVFRVFIDEFGCGNEEQAHSQLYRNLLTELGMATDVACYLDSINPESFAYVNHFHWLASRAPAPEYFLGGYAYFEASVLYGFRSYAHAAARLGIKNGRYYTEHLYIDNYHSKHMRTALRETDRDIGLDLAKVWAGVELTSAIVSDATEAAIARARGAG